jgi:hypothetical protein
MELSRRVWMAQPIYGLNWLDITCSVTDLALRAYVRGAAVHRDADIKKSSLNRWLEVFISVDEMTSAAGKNWHGGRCWAID